MMPWKVALVDSLKFQAIVNGKAVISLAEPGPFTWVVPGNLKAITYTAFRRIGVILIVLPVAGKATPEPFLA
jgi:alkyl hydroperoxide reductase subunit AhpC